MSSLDIIWPLDRKKSLHGHGECCVLRGGERHISQGQQHRQHHRQNLGGIRHMYPVQWSQSVPEVCKTRCGSGWWTAGCWRLWWSCRGQAAGRSGSGMRSWDASQIYWSRSETECYLSNSKQNQIYITHKTVTHHMALSMYEWVFHNDRAG